MDRLTRKEIEAARSLLNQTIDEVCGACESNCCFQGTMVGSADARRIAKAARLSPEFKQRLIEGIRKRGAELRRDLAGLETAARLLRVRFAGEKEPELTQLDAALGRWRDLCDFLETEFQGEPDDFPRCLVYSALRANALRAMRAFPGGERVLPALAGKDTSFQFGRRGLKPDRCLFHVEGCIIPTAKPHKCADFYCSSDPGLIHHVVKHLTFDEFTLAHFVPYRRGQFLSDLEAELVMGREFFEAKAVLGGDQDFADAIIQRLADVFPSVRSESLGSGHFDATVDLPELGRLSDNEALIIHCGSVDALGLYELAVLLVRARGSSLQPAIVLVAETFHRHSGAVHALWRDRAMAQPLSSMVLVGIVED